MSQHRARKRFGQNFLHDAHVIDRIIQAIDPRENQHLVEIGPGQGALTRGLLDSGCRLTIVEIDRDLVARLEDDPALSRARIISADALTVDFGELAQDGPVRLVGNLPYNVSTPLMFHALESIDHLSDMHFMLQKEVVDRMAAEPGCKAFGRLSVMLQYRCRIEPLFVVRPGSFHPVPKVNSSVVRLVPKLTHEPQVSDERMLARVVTAGFGKRRKTIANALKGVADSEHIVAAGIDPGARAEQLSVADFVRIANQLEAT